MRVDFSLDFTANLTLFTAAWVGADEGDGGARDRYVLEGDGDERVEGRARVHGGAGSRWRSGGHTMAQLAGGHGEGAPMRVASVA